MAKYSIIADAGEALVELLCGGLVPELIPDKNGICLCSPAEKGDVSLGIWLYDIRESSEVRTSGLMDMGGREQRFPPMYLNLYYMLTAYASSDLKFRAAQEHRILGRAMQVLQDNNRIAARSPGDMDMRIELLSLEIQEQREIWSGGEMPYRTSLFYRVTPAVLESEKRVAVSRVRDVDITVREKGRGNGDSF